MIELLDAATALTRRTATMTNLTNVFLSLGLTRDSATFWWGKVVSVAALITSGLFDPHIAGMFDPAVLGIGPSTLHWIQFVSVIVLYLSGQMSTSKLPGASSPSSRTPPASEGSIMKTPAVLLAIGLALSLTAACAAKGPLAKAQVAALTAGQSAHEIRTLEASLYAAGRYDKAKHDELLEKGVLPIIDGALGYERAVAACTAAPCSNVDQAQKALVSALDELDKITPAVDAVRTPLAAATAALRVLLAKTSSSRNLPMPMQSQEIPTGGVMALLAIAEMVAGAYSRIRAALVKEGATPEQLAAMDAMLVNDRAEVEAELAKDKASNPTS